MPVSQTRVKKRVALIALVALMGARARAQDAPKTAAPPAPQPTVDDAKIAGQEVRVPARKKYVAPEYPAAAAEHGIRGIVILDLLIGESGAVLEARVTRSIPGLDEAAITAVKLWEYEPTKMSGRPVKVRLSQSITFSLKLPDLQRAPGVPELKAGGLPSAPANLTGPESASVAVVLGPDGEVKEASVLSGSSSVSESLLRVVKAWRFVAGDQAAPITFAIRADWTPGPPPVVTLKAIDPKPVAARADAAATRNPGASEPRVNASARTGTSEAPAPAGAQTPLTPAVPTDVLPSQAAPQTPERGLSTIADVVLGDNIPDLAKGRKPVWPPLARLGNVTGEVVVRFSVDVAGKVTVHSAEGPDLLKASAEGAVATWLFRRTSIDRLHLIATFKFGNDRSMARVERAP